MLYQILPLPVPLQPRLFLFVVLLWSSTSLSAVNSQSSCSFMRQTKYILDSMPDAPENAIGLRTCGVTKKTCCTREIEAQMEEEATRRFEGLINGKVEILEKFFESHISEFQGLFRDSLRAASAELDRMFARTYGPFYLSHSQMFKDFFERLSNTFSTNLQLDPVRLILDDFYRTLYRIIFELMNPVHKIGPVEERCLNDIYHDVRPFGDLPESVENRLLRTFNVWRSFLNVLKEMRVNLRTMEKITLSSSCIQSISRLVSCAACNGESPLARPCLRNCLQTFDHCLEEVSKIDSQWNVLIDTLIRLTDRMARVHEPRVVLQPAIIEISEAVMAFQERGQIISQTIAGRCFNRMTRKSKRSAETNKIFGIDEQRLSSLDSVDLETKFLEFGEMLSRMKNFWSLIPQSVCQENQLAASPDESCWNGSALQMDSYNSSLNNPPTRRQKNGGKYTNQRLKLITLSDYVSATMKGIFKNVEYPEGSGDGEFFPPDDEDYVEGSGTTAVSVEIVNFDSANVSIDDSWYESQKKAAERGGNPVRVLLLFATGVVIRILFE